MHRACVSVKRLPWTSTKPSRYSVSINGLNRKIYSLSIVPCEKEYDHDEDAARFVAEKYLKDQGIGWKLIDHSTFHRGSFVFIAN